MKNVFKILTFIILVTGFIFARGNDLNSSNSVTYSNVSIKVNKYYFDVNTDDDLLYKKRSWKRRKIKRKPRRGRDNR